MKKGPAPSPVPTVRVIPLEETEAPEPATEARTPSKADLANAAQVWLDEASFAPIPEQQELLLRSAAALIEADRLDESKRVLNAVNVSGLSVQYAQRKRLLRAQLALAEDRPELALRYIAGFRGMQDLWPQFKSSVLSIRARGYVATGQPVKALYDLVQRELYLEDDRDIDANRVRIWTLLGSLNPIELQIESQAARDAVLNDWLDLALLYADFGADPYRLRQTVSQWARINPAGSPQSFARGQLLPEEPPDRVRKIALLLPLASRFGQAAQSVHDGFMAMRELDSDPNAPDVVVYDVGEVPELAGSYYRLAAEEGADMIVGPLGKQAATGIVTHQAVLVPTLLLGGIDRGNVLPRNAYSIDLAPEQDAIKAADRAFFDGHRVAAVLTPDSEWGQRVAQAFIERWQSLGGTVVKSAVYDEASNDHSFVIQELLNINSSRGRMSALSASLGAALEFKPRRRQDLDMIFLAAHPVAGRLMKPQINFFHAHDIPVYATSHIYSGTPDKINDADLNQVVFGDMPWLLRNDHRIRTLRTAAYNRVGNSGGLDRLYALGMDAYLLSRVIPVLDPGETLSVKGVTGERLDIGRDRHVDRQLTWARFEDGEPSVIEYMDEGDGYESFELEQTARTGHFIRAGSANGTTGLPIPN